MNAQTPGIRGIVLVVTVMLAAVTANGGQYHETFSTTDYLDTAVSSAEWSTSDGEIRLYEYQPEIRAVAPTAASVRGVAVDGHVVYVADYSNGLVVYAWTGSGTPSQIGHFSTAAAAYGVATNGHYAYMAVGSAGLVVLDVSNPASITQVGALGSLGITYTAAVDGPLLYLASYNGGMKIVDVSDPTTPTLVGSYTGVTAAYDVSVDGHLAYVASYLQDVKILDVSDPAAIVELGTYDTPGHNYGVCADGDRLYVADGTAGLKVLDVTDPTAPTLLGSISTGGNTRSVAVSGEWVIAADYNWGLALVDASNPASMTVAIGSTPFYGSKVAVSGGTAFVAGWTSGLWVMDIGTTLPMQSVGGNPSPFGWGRMDRAGEVVWVASSINGLIGLDCADPQNPAWLGQYTPGTGTDFTYGVAVAGDYAYAANTTLGIHIVDISDPTAPFLAGSQAGLYRDIEVAGNLLYVLSADGNGITSFTLTSPTVPAPAAYVSFPGYANSITRAGDYLYAPSSPGGLRIFHLEPNGAMSAVATYASSTAKDVVVQGGYAFLADGATGVSVLDVRNPASPTLSDVLSTGGAAVTVLGDGFDLYVGLAGGGLERWNIADPVNPFVVETYSTTHEIEGMNVRGDYLYLGEGLGGIEVVSVRQRRFKTSLDRIQSTVFVTTSQDAVRINLNATATAEVSWEVSANAGSDWVAVPSGAEWTALTQPGDQLLWRSTHAVRNPQVNPSCSDLQIQWLAAPPAVASIGDVPGDQGRQVSLTWTRSGHDFVGDPQQVVEYSVYRRIDSGAASASDKAYPPGAWHFVVTVPADAEESYAVVAPTLVDSTATDPGYSVFFVRARTAVPGVYFDADPASGYSVDNLAPSVPSGLLMATPGILTWEESVDTDFRYFTVYSSLSPVRDGSTVEIDRTTGISLDVTGQPPAYFLVTATDFAGNESEPAVLDQVSAAPGPDLPRQTALRGNAPNPFNPSTSIDFDLATAAPVRLTVFDVAGRVVRALLDGNPLPAGRHSARWDGRNADGRPAAAGVYLYRLETGAYRETRSMTLLK